MNNTLLNHLESFRIQNKKGFVVLIDPDNITEQSLEQIILLSIQNKIDFFFIGGSLISNNITTNIILRIQEKTSIPIIIFPGSSTHINSLADGILFLSLVSGRNADFLIGQHLVSAPILKKSKLEVLPTAYLLIDGGVPTTVSYISNTLPIPHNKPGIAACTAMASEMLGMKIIFMDAGSGAVKNISEQMIRYVRESVELPIIIGGGITSAEKAKVCFEAGADLIVVGNGIETNINLINEIGQIIR